VDVIKNNVNVSVARSRGRRNAEIRCRCLDSNYMRLVVSRLRPSEGIDLLSKSSVDVVV